MFIARLAPAIPVAGLREPSGEVFVKPRGKVAMVSDSRRTHEVVLNCILLLFTFFAKPTLETSMREFKFLQSRSVNGNVSIDDLPELFEAVRNLQVENYAMKSILQGLIVASENDPRLQSALLASIASAFPQPGQFYTGWRPIEQLRKTIKKLLPISLDKLVPGPDQ